MNILLYLFTLPFRLLPSAQTNDGKSPRSFLIVRLDNLGDVMLSTPIYHSLKERFPQSRITVLCGSWALSLLENNPYVDSIIALDCPWFATIGPNKCSPHTFIRSLIKTIRAIRRARFDTFIDLRGHSLQIFLFGWLPAIPVRISTTRSDGTFLMTDPVAHRDEDHEIVKNYRLIQKYAPLNSFYKTEVYSNAHDLASLLAKTGVEVDKPFSVIFNGGSSPLRHLSNARIAALHESLKRNFGLSSFYVGGMNDHREGEAIKRMLRNGSNDFHNICGKINFNELRELICKARIFIGTDSSVTHLSASTDTPSVSLFGPLSPEQVQPLGTNKLFLHHKYPCCPCAQRQCVLTGSNDRAACIEDISVEEITHMVSHLLAG
ncbi:MAG: glycosyltransferase family 9 protein [Syntrophobacteraceae bacterium]|nr:glycosyltransferase family 9 protein [Syntrophobacteraceae bacterium]